MLTQQGRILHSWSQKRALAREILGDDLLLREATPDLSGDRCKFDLMMFEGKLGTRGPKKSEDPWDFDFTAGIPADSEEVLSPSLKEFIEEFHRELPAISKYLRTAQIRFRSDEKGQFGIWLDSSREELEKYSRSDTCESMQNIFYVELGQKGDLTPRRAHSWLPSFSKDNEEIPLVSYVSSFSQPGPEANRALIACGLELLEDLAPNCKKWMELGAGYGNLTAAYTTLLGAPVWILEKDGKDSSLWDLNEKYFKGAKFYRQSVETFNHEESPDLLLADPPRSGFSEFFRKDFIQARYVLLYNCDLRGLLKDSEALKPRYQLKSWSLVDLFPGTPYAEAITLWQRR